MDWDDVQLIKGVKLTHGAVIIMTRTKEGNVTRRRVDLDPTLSLIMRPLCAPEPSRRGTTHHHPGSGDVHGAK